MSIQPTGQFKTVSVNQQDSAARQRNVTTHIPEKNSGTDSSSEVQISQLTLRPKNDTSQDIDMGRVNSVKAKIENGTLITDYEKIATKLIDNMILF